MRKFKLIKEYPGSPKLGIEIEFKKGIEFINPAKVLTGLSTEIYLKLEDCIKHSEIWQEITELPVGTKVKDTWCTHSSYIFIKKEDGWQYQPTGKFQDIESEIGVGKRFEIIEEQSKEYEILSFSFPKRWKKKISCSKKW